MQLMADKALCLEWFERKAAEYKKNQLSGSSLRAPLAGKSKLYQALKLLSFPTQSVKICNGKRAINRDCDNMSYMICSQEQGS